jgi:hypothetical protein
MAKRSGGHKQLLTLFICANRFSRLTEAKAASMLFRVPVRLMSDRELRRLEVPQDLDHRRLTTAYYQWKKGVSR